MLNSVWKNKIFIIIIALICCFLPQTILKPAQTEVRGIAIGIGIDKAPETVTNGDAIEVSVQIIVPHYSTGFSDNAQVISSTGKNLADAIEKMSVHLGKIIGLSHCSVVVLGKDLQGEIVSESLDGLYRSKRLDNNALVVYTEGSAKEVMQTIIKAGNSLSLSLNNIIQLNETLDITNSAQITDVLETIYKKHGANLISTVNVVEEDYLGLSVSGQSSNSGNSMNSSGGQSSGQSGSSSKTAGKYISNNGDTAIFKNGNILAVINNEQIRGFNILLNEAQRGAILLKNVSDSTFNNADISVSERGEILSYTVDYTANGKPRIFYNIFFKIRIEQILEGGDNSQYLQGGNDYVTKGVKNAMINYVKEEVAEAINISKQNNADCFNLYEKFDAFSHKKWQEYLNSLENRDDYMKDVQFFVNVNVFGSN